MSKVKLKKHFITGVLATLPLFVTIYILYFIYKIIAGIVMMILPIEFITKQRKISCVYCFSSFICDIFWSSIFGRTLY